MKISVPYGEEFEINTIVLDLNGTLAVHGKVVEGTSERLKKLKDIGLRIVLFTGNQRGNAEELCKNLDIECKVTQKSEDKERQIKLLDPDTCASIGNARIDIGTFKHARLSIATLQAEGIHADVLKHVDIIVPSINDALDLFLNNDSLCASLRI